MRKVLMVVAFAGCSGPSDNKTQLDAAVVGDAVIEVDAMPAVDGMWRDTYHTASGPETMPSCTTPPTAVSVDDTSGNVSAYPGMCMPDGSFRILAPGNLGTYYLRVGGVFYETNKRSGIDLSTDRLGRNDVAAITGVTLDLDMTGLQTWTATDSLVAFGPNIGYRQNLNFTAGAPTAGDIALSSATAPWNGYRVDGVKSDALMLLQLGGHTSSGIGYDYKSLDRMYNAPTFSMTNNTPSAITGSFVTGTAATLTLTVNVASFNQFASSVAPSVSLKTVQGSAFAAVSTNVIESPPLVSFGQNSDGISTMIFGTLAHTDPFPSSWLRMVRLQVGFTVPYSFGAASGSLVATVARVVTKATANTTTVAANVGPPTQIQFDGTDAFTDDGISTVPMVTWQGPIVGNATDYEVQIYEVKTSGASMTFTTALRLVTKQTSVRIPHGYLIPQKQYVFSIRARNREGVDIYTTPLRNGATWSSAEALSAIVTVF